MMADSSAGELVVHSDNLLVEWMVALLVALKVAHSVALLVEKLVAEWAGW